MKVLFALPVYHQNYDGMVAGLLAAGHDVAVLVRAARARDSHRPGVQVTVLGAASPGVNPDKRVRGLLPAFRLAFGYLRRTRPDLVIARNADSTSYAIFLAARLLGIRYLLYVQSRGGYETMSPGRRLRLRLGLWPRHTINATPSAPAAPIAGKTLDFVPFAVEILGPERTDDPTAPPIRVLSVAKLDRTRKNLAPLVRCLAPLLRSGAARLTIAGLNPPDPAPPYGDLLDEISRQGVDAQVTVLQNLDYAATRRLYADHDLFVLASSRELAAISPAEAMAAGLPVVVGSDNGTNYFVEPGETGFIFPDGDFAALAAYVTAFAEAPRDCARMGRNARRAIAERYSPAAYAGRLSDVVARRFGRPP